MNFPRASTKTVDIKSENFPLINGGMLSANLYKITDDFIIHYEEFYPINDATSGATTSGSAKDPNTVTSNVASRPVAGIAVGEYNPSMPDPSTSDIYNKTLLPRTWYEPKGEIVFFKKPSQFLEV